MDLKLDSTGDLAIEDNDLVLLDGVDAIAQDVEVRLRFFLGEWFLDTRLGVPYYQKILGQKPRLTAVAGIFRKAILTTPGMLSITNFEIDYDGPTRALSISFRGTSIEGDFLFNKELII